MKLVKFLENKKIYGDVYFIIKKDGFNNFNINENVKLKNDKTRFIFTARDLEIDINYI